MSTRGKASPASPARQLNDPKSKTKVGSTAVRENVGSRLLRSCCVTLLGFDRDARVDARYSIYDLLRGRQKLAVLDEHCPNIRQRRIN